jgi:hypothetical protein
MPQIAPLLPAERPDEAPPREVAAKPDATQSDPPPSDTAKPDAAKSDGAATAPVKPATKKRR